MGDGHLGGGGACECARGEDCLDGGPKYHPEESSAREEGPDVDGQPSHGGGLFERTIIGVIVLWALQEAGFLGPDFWLPVLLAVHRVLPQPLGRTFTGPALARGVWRSSSPQLLLVDDSEDWGWADEEFPGDEGPWSGSDVEESRAEEDPFRACYRHLDYCLVFLLYPTLRHERQNEYHRGSRRSMLKIRMRKIAYVRIRTELTKSIARKRPTKLPTFTNISIFGNT